MQRQDNDKMQDEQPGDERKQDEQILDLDEFVNALSSSEKVRPSDLAALFDLDRKPWPLERIFHENIREIRKAKVGVERLFTSPTMKLASVNSSSPPPAESNPLQSNEENDRVIAWSNEENGPPQRPTLESVDYPGAVAAE